MSISRFREITLRAARTFTKGYSEVQSKVREATSNDPWVSEKQLEEIAKLTNNPDFFQEIVGVLEKRLNDIGKNWRHVLKALIVLEYAFQRGSGSLFTHFKGKIYIINTLKEFRYVEGKQDFGAHVRQQAMHVADLLMLDSPHRLREKRKTRPDILRTSATASFPLDDPAQHQDVQHPRRRALGEMKYELPEVVLNPVPPSYNRHRQIVVPWAQSPNLNARTLRSSGSRSGKKEAFRML
ncbi:ENTH-domain-containing protein [Rickenella mellea]|uniref:ENTH-domain-containing protein n=1 Tax=Rickenella mellea TaxID=50990 RepID=A0A4Y7PFX8_9AGAM|nr:ENTH-domain-containing protein [Rickenella mellea]